MKLELKQQFQIESARRLPKLPASHPCSRMHGHSFRVILTLVGEVDPEIGWVMDYQHVVNKVAPTLELLDHRVLNEVPGLDNPTSEHLCVWLFDRLRVVLPELVRVTVAETSSTECSFPA